MHNVQNTNQIIKALNKPIYLETISYYISTFYFVYILALSTKSKF